MCYRKGYDHVLADQSMPVGYELAKNAMTPAVDSFFKCQKQMANACKNLTGCIQAAPFLQQ